MTRGSSIALLAAALVIGAGALCWTQVRSGRADRALASAAASGNLHAETSAPHLPAQPNSLAHVVPASVEPAVPRAGEILEFVADVSKLTNVANLRLQVLDRRDFFGKNAWHLQAFAHTENPLRYIFELDDQFDSYSDAGTLSSLQYEMHLSERGEKVDSIQRMTTTGRDPAPPNASETRVPAGTRDPLGLMQYLRTVDWSKIRQLRSPVYDGHKLYDVRASISGSNEPVQVPAGSYTTSKVDIHVFEGGTELNDARFSLYLANNPTRTPVLLEAVMPFATARVQLSKVK